MKVKVIYELQNRVIMVAGGAGFIGSALVRELLDRKAKVISYDNYLHGREDNLRDLKEPFNELLTVLKGNVLNIKQLIQVITDYSVDYIINCIGDPFVPTSCYKPQRVLKTNIEGTLNLLEAVKICKIKRILHVSSCEIYGKNRAYALSEDAPLNPLNTYAVSKAIADRFCFAFYMDYKIPVVIARPFNCYGPRATHPYIIPEIIAQLNKGHILELGNITKRDFTYVHDIARALIAVLEADIPNGEVVNIGTGKAYSIESLASKLANIMGISKFEIRSSKERMREHDIEIFLCNNAKLCRYVGWSPQVGIEEGLRRTVAWYRENGSQWSWESSSEDVRF